MIEPLGRQLLIEPDPQPKEIGVIAIPESAMDRGNSGVIVDRGEGAHEVFAIGTRVIFKPFTGTHFEYGGTSLILMAPEDVLAVLRSGAPKLGTEVA